jgi:hypothetical protein
MEKATREALASKAAYDESREFENQVRVRKDTIIQEEAENLEKMAIQFEKEATFDGSTGECCFKFENATAAKCIMVLDIMFFLLDPPRGVAAFQAYKDYSKSPYYAKTRNITFWIYSVLILLGTIGYIFAIVI